MKKIIFAFLLFLLTPLTTHAISFDELTNNPAQFKNVYESIEDSYYIDVNTIKTIRYAPPYYTMKAQGYTIDYKYQLIMKHDVLTNYNYNRSFKSMAIKLRHEHPNMSTRQIAEILVKELNKDSGISASTDNVTLYKFNGELVGNPKSTYNNNYQSIHIASPSASIANYMFYKGYNMYFFNPSLIKRN